MARNRRIEWDEKTGVLPNVQRELPRLIAAYFSRVRKVLAEDGSPRKLHKLRLASKRLRYTLELFETVYGNKTKPMMGSLKGLQAKLGAINDCATTLEMVRRDRGAADAVRRLAGKREAEFRMYWKKHFGLRAKVRWKAVLRAADGEK